MSFEFSPVGYCESILVSPGFYLLEVWGAQGGTCGVDTSGRGGYSKGIYHASKTENLTICVGTSGKCSDTESVAGGFNGGGNSAKTPQEHYHQACSGGGATDIRKGDSPDNRIIVAGGGGDNAVSAIGVGAVSPGDAFISLGTSGVLFVVTDAYRPAPQSAVHAFCHVLPNLWHQMSVMLSAASCLQWFCRLVGVTETELLEEIAQLSDADKMAVV